MFFCHNHCGITVHLRQCPGVASFEHICLLCKGRLNMQVNNTTILDIRKAMIMVIGNDDVIQSDIIFNPECFLL